MVGVLFLSGDNTFLEMEASVNFASVLNLGKESKWLHFRDTYTVTLWKL